MRPSFILLLAFVAASSSLAQGSRLVILGWDGAPGWVVERMVNEGKLPNLQRMKERGVYSNEVWVAPPTKTASGFAQVWTGAFPSTTGITGNTVPMLPRSEHTITETGSGFDSASLGAEPIWVSAVNAGKTAAVLSATQSYPANKWVEMIAEERREAEAEGRPVLPDLANLYVFSGFETELYAPAVYTESVGLVEANRFGRVGKEFEFSVGDQRFIAFFATGLDGKYHDCTLFRVSGDRPVFSGYMRANGSEFTQPLEVRLGEETGYLSFALLHLDSDLSSFILYQGEARAIKGHYDFTFGENYMRALGGWYDIPVYGIYDEGKLGPTFWMGGGGAAERRVLTLIERDYTRLSDAIGWVVRSIEPHLIIHYSPATDTMGHRLMGILDPSSPKHNPELAEKLWPVYEQTLILADAWLGRVVEAVGSQGVVAVVSDHGMAGAARQVSVNRILVDAGLATETNGQIDAGRSRALCAPWQDVSVSVHTTDWKDGVVPQSEKDRVIRQATEALLAFRDPETGKQVITRVLPASEIPGAGGPAGGDIYLEFAPGYVPTSRLAAAAVSGYGGETGGGVHGFLPGARKMDAIFYAAGPGIAPGRNLGRMRAIDVIPSLAILVGIPTPAYSEGTNLRLTLRQ